MKPSGIRKMERKEKKKKKLLALANLLQLKEDNPFGGSANIRVNTKQIEDRVQQQKHQEEDQGPIAAEEALNQEDKQDQKHEHKNSNTNKLQTTQPIVDAEGFQLVIKRKKHPKASSTAPSTTTILMASAPNVENVAVEPEIGNVSAAPEVSNVSAGPDVDTAPTAASMVQQIASGSNAAKRPTDDEPQVKKTRRIDKSVESVSTQAESEPSKPPAEPVEAPMLVETAQEEKRDPGDGLTASERELRDLRRLIRQGERERSRVVGQLPYLHLRDMGERALVTLDGKERTPLFLTDIQNLIMTAMVGRASPCSPERWCYLERSHNVAHTVVLVADGLSLFHYLAYQHFFQASNRIFSTRLEVVLPSQVDSTVMQEIVQVPLTQLQAEMLIAEHGCLSRAIEYNKNPTLFAKTLFPIKDSGTANNNNDEVLPPTDQFPRTKLLLSALQMVDEGYPMPLSGELDRKFKDYVYTRDHYTPVTNHSPMFGVDCEMCRTSAGYTELTRITIVNEKYETVYETLVRPLNQITDYLTRYSGITEEIMKSVTKTLKEVQQEVRNILPSDAILVGQSLNCDLNAMKMFHPYVIDTSVCFNLSGRRRHKAKLQTLALKFLEESIQANEDGHDSTEDSIASLKLVQLKLSHSIEFGDEILMQKRRKQEFVSAKYINNNLLAHSSQRDKRTCIISVGELEPTVKSIIRKAEEAVPPTSMKAVSLHEVESNGDAIQKATEIALESHLTIVNLRYDEQTHLRPDVVEGTIQALDEWMSKLWQTAVAHNGLFMTIMGGAQECKNGLVKVALKRNMPYRYFGPTNTSYSGCSDL